MGLNRSPERHPLPVILVIFAETSMPMDSGMTVCGVWLAPLH